MIFNLEVSVWYEPLKGIQLEKYKTTYNLHIKYKQNYKANKKQIDKINVMDDDFLRKQIVPAS